MELEEETPMTNKSLGNWEGKERRHSTDRRSGVDRRRHNRGRRRLLLFRFLPNRRHGLDRRTGEDRRKETRADF